jgi:hypothetical protein
MATLTTNIAVRLRQARKRKKKKKDRMPSVRRMRAPTVGVGGIAVTGLQDLVDIAIENAVASLFQEGVEKRGGHWVVVHHTGKKKGQVVQSAKKYKSKKDALKQHTAIIMSKMRRGKM